MSESLPAQTLFPLFFCANSCAALLLLDLDFAGGAHARVGSGLGVLARQRRVLAEVSVKVFGLGSLGSCSGFC